eukprot:symbB.v1.2.018015.t1/scaffold1375.1/size122712/7
MEVPYAPPRVIPIVPPARTLAEAEKGQFQGVSRGDYLLGRDGCISISTVAHGRVLFFCSLFLFFHSDEASRSPCAIAMAMAFVSSATRGAVAAPRPARLPAPVAEWHVHGGSFSTSQLLTAGVVFLPASYAGVSRRRRQPRRLSRRATQGDEIKFASSSTSQAEPTEAEALPLPLQQRAQGIAEALPELAQLSGSVVVIKYGGAAMVESPERTIRDVATLAAMGLKPATWRRPQATRGFWSMEVVLRSTAGWPRSASSLSLCVAFESQMLTLWRWWLWS